MFDGEAFGLQMVEIVRGHVTAELDPLRAENKALAEANTALANRVAELEARALPLQGEPGPAGADADMDALSALVVETVERTVAALPPAEKGEPGEPGKDADLEQIIIRLADPIDEAAIRATGAQIAKALAALPAPEKGEPGEPGQSIDLDAAVDAVMAKVEARGLLERPKDGEPGKDGLGLADALIDRSGSLVLTMTDGSTKALGPVVGTDGAPGRDGIDGHTFTLDDFEIVPMDERTIKMGFTYGEVMHSFELALPVVIYRGVWREGETYQRGDMVTWAGSTWHCDKQDCLSKPDGGDFTLAVKRGRDGKDAVK